MVNPSELETLDAPRLRELTRELVEQLSAQQHENHQRAQSIESLKRELLFKSTRIEQLSYELARYKRLRFARSSEALNGVQASLLAEALDCDLAAIEEELEQLRERPKSAARHRPRREALPAHLPRVAVHHEPEVKSCSCGCALTRIGEDISEKLAYEPGVFTVERHIRGKWVCAQCQTLIQAPLPAQIIDKGIATAGLLAQVMVAKFSDHLPLYRQEVLFARAGYAIARSTLGRGWAPGGCSCSRWSMRSSKGCSATRSDSSWPCCAGGSA